MPKYQVLSNRMISHAGVDYNGGDNVELRPEKAKLHLDHNNIAPFAPCEETTAIALAPVQLLAEIE